MATEYADNPPQYFKPNIPNNSPDVAGYSVTVTDDGATNIFRKNKNNTLQAVGKIVKGGGFSAVPLGQFSNQATQAEINYFTANARKTVTDQAVPVVRRGIGGSAGGGNAKINQILGTNLSSQSTNPDQQGGTAPPATGSPDAQGGSTPTSPQQPSQQTSGATLVYPNDLASTNQDRIKFQALTYSPKALPSQGFESITPNYSAAPGQGAVFLPVQASISDQNAVGWEPDTLNPIEKFAVGLSKNVMESGGAEDVTARVTSFFKEALEGLRASSPEVRTYLAGQAVGVNNLLSRLNGKVLNPNLELLFNGPQLRPFSFTFKLSPRSAEEAKTVKQIINYFKRNMAPIVGDQGLFIKAPNIFEIKYQYGQNKDSPHPGLNLIKKCALTNCSVDYTPLGTYMTYPEGTMVSYTMSLQFQEIEPVYSRDYKDPSQIEF
jgi:hypothetical protein